MNYSKSVEKMKILFHWKEEGFQLNLVDVEPETFWFECQKYPPSALAAPTLSFSVLVGQKWRGFENIASQWVESQDQNIIGLSPNLTDAQKKEFKKYLELTLSV